MPTTNNNWPTPVATDLVKDGWEAIKDLGDAIDTTLGVYAPSTPGLTLINTTSFSAVASQNITGVFSSLYENYKIVYRCTKSTDTFAFLRLLVGTTPDTGADNYVIEHISATGNPASITGVGANQAAFFISPTDSQAQFGSIEILQPFVAIDTLFLSTNFTGGYSTDAKMRLLNGRHRQSTSFDGFQLVANSGTITGKVFVYGFNN
jgi:hypothetical protein